MSLYRKIPQCRVCRSPHGDKIDQDLVLRKSYKVLLETYGPLFPEDKPLTKGCLQTHWKHFREAVDLAALTRSAMPVAEAALSPNYPPHGETRQEIFEAAVQQRVNEIEVLEQLVHSGLDDLQRIQAKEGENEFAVLNRDRVRKSTADIVMSSAKVKQMAVQADEDRHRLEKGRLIFRMFQLVGRAFEALPLEFRSVVAAQLKEAIRDDDELNSLLKEQAAKPALPAGDAA